MRPVINENKRQQIKEKHKNGQNSKNLRYSINIAGRLPANSRDILVDLQSQKDIKKTDEKRNSILLNAEMLILD